MKPVRFIEFDRPMVGDCFHRYSLHDLYEEAMVVSIIGQEDHPEQWTAVIMTRNGAEFISSGKDFRGRCDWVPASWTYDSFNKTWLEPGEEVEEDAEIKREEVPTPERDERYMAWRARVFREFPALREQQNVKRVLSDVWRSRDVEATAK
jgi:hypothetical protein